MEKFNDVYLLVGGNIDNTKEKYDNLFRFLEQEVGKIEKISDFYQSKPWGFESENDFINLAVWIKTSLPPLDLLRKTQLIEKKLGRNEKTIANTYSDRTMDIDIIFYNDFVCQYENLIIPHPKMQERQFVLTPLAEIAPWFVHPLFNKSIQTLKQECGTE